jgi:hypothetical protein
MAQRPITTNWLRREANLERWDRRGIPVRVRTDDGREFAVTGIYNDREALVLAIEPDEEE